MRRCYPIDTLTDDPDTPELESLAAGAGSARDEKRLAASHGLCSSLATPGERAG